MRVGHETEHTVDFRTDGTEGGGSSIHRWSEGEIVAVSWIRSDSILAQPLAKIHFLAEGWPFSNWANIDSGRSCQEEARREAEVSSRSHFSYSMSLVDSEMI